MRCTYLVCYDIRNNKRLRKVFKICKNFGNHLQFSVFECDLSASEKIRMEMELKSVLKMTEDQVLLIPLGRTEHRGNRLITALGTPYVPFDAPCYVV